MKSNRSWGSTQHGDNQPSGIALLQRRGQRWKCLRVGPSCVGFCDGFAWSDQQVIASFDVAKLLDACAHHSNHAKPLAVAIDMPLSTKPINGRRHADDLVSQRFGHRKCAVHSPTSKRPGATGRRLQQGFLDSGYVLATSANHQTPALLEVYPHVALLGLTGHGERLPYKAGKTNTYWRGQSLEHRKQGLIENWQLILDHLRTYIDDIELPLPDPREHSFDYLKRFEDAIDGLVCAWVATQYLSGEAVPVGNDAAAIWMPRISMPFAKEINGAQQEAR